MVIGDGRFVSPDGTEESLRKGAAYSVEELLAHYAGNFLCQPSVFFTAEALHRAGPVAEELVYSMDLDLWLRMRAVAEAEYIARPLAMLRRHDAAKTWAGNYEAMREIAQTLRRHDHVLPLLRRIANRVRMRHCRAHCSMQRALEHVLAGGGRGRALALAAEALCISPSAMLTREAARVAVRLALPDAIRRTLRK